MILSVIASLLSIAAFGKLFMGLFMLAMFERVSLLSLKNFSILSLSLIIRSVKTWLSSLFSVMADEAEPYRWPNGSELRSEFLLFT